MNLFNTEKYLSPQDRSELQKFEQAYKSQVESKKTSQQIPKVIHFIWIGPKPFAPKSTANVLSWIERHPDWTFKFWTDRKDRPLPHEKMVLCRIDSVSHPVLDKYLGQTKSYGEKSDLLRYAILIQEGGVYVDHDINCLQSFEQLNDSFDFYTFLEPPHYIPGYPLAFYPGNGLIAAVPNHPIILAAMRYVDSCWDRVQSQFPKPRDYFFRVIQRTFRAFIEGVNQELNSDAYKNLVLPAGLLYSAEDARESKRLFARHQFEGAWLAPELNDY